MTHSPHRYPTPTRNNANTGNERANPDSAVIDAPEHQTNRNQRPPHPHIGKPSERYAEYRVKHGKNGAVEKAHLGVRRTEIGLNLLRQNGQNVAVDEVEDVNDDQNAQHVVGVPATRTRMTWRFLFFCHHPSCRHGVTITWRGLPHCCNIVETPSEPSDARSACPLRNANDGVATITLNRPEALNAMTDALMTGVSDAFERVRTDETIRVVVLTGREDVASVPAQTSTTLQRPHPIWMWMRRRTVLLIAAMRALMSCPVPTVARINGAAAGGGFGLALACDITVAANSAFFVATFGPRLGIVPDMGATWSIPRAVGRARALGITLLGDRISAPDAERWGLIWKCVSDEALDAEVERITGVLRRSAPAATTRIRQAVDAALDNPFLGPAGPRDAPPSRADSSQHARRRNCVHGKA